MLLMFSRVMFCRMVIHSITVYEVRVSLDEAVQFLRILRHVNTYELQYLYHATVAAYSLLYDIV